jgi:hypothetical protein
MGLVRRALAGEEGDEERAGALKLLGIAPIPHGTRHARRRPRMYSHRRRVTHFEHSGRCVLSFRVEVPMTQLVRMRLTRGSIVSERLECRMQPE